MLVNDNRYAVTGGTIATVSSNKWAPFTFLHEVEHSFAGIADEYVEEPTAQYFPIESIPDLPNVDNTSDLTKIKWTHLQEYKAIFHRLAILKVATTAYMVFTVLKRTV
jgi:hypothetical protein